MVNVDGKYGRRLASAAPVPVTTFSAAGRPKAIGGVADVQSGADVTAFVDYSHKPGAVQAVLSSLRPVTRDILIIVFGSGGDRDRGKRAMMGAAAASLPDEAIPASDNPRSEDPLDFDGIADGLSAAVARSRWRMEVRWRTDGVTIVDDAYNANLESARAALEALGHLARDGRGLAILGHMAEFGQSLRAFREEIGEFAAQVGLAGLIAVGQEAAPILTEARRVRSWPGEAFGVPDGLAALAVLGDRLNRTRRRCTGEGISRRRLGDRGGRAARPGDDLSPREGIREADR